MATALGSEGAVPIPIMGESQGHFAVEDDYPPPSPDPQSPPHTDAPPPNPAFSFPARLDSPSSAPSSFSRARGRRPMSAAGLQDTSFSLPAEDVDRARRSAPLPVFSFNPGASLPPDLNSPLLSPPITPNSPGMGPSQARPAGHGHRRGGSEFVGGRLREGNSIAVMSTSPTKSESGFASPTFQPPRRGHRRGVSSAISTNDLPILLPPPINPIGKGSSAPTSPTNFDQQEDYMSLVGQGLPNNPPEPSAALQPSGGDTPINDADESVAKDNPKQARPGTRTRVGFSDTLEYIPRPLSMVSTDTSSTATTRPGHSVSESLSSIISAAPPSGRESPAPLSRSPTRDLAESRPSTAGAILEGIHGPHAASGSNLSPRRRNSIPALLDVTDKTTVTPPTPSPTKPKRWSFFGLEPFASGSPTKARPCSSSSTESTPRAVSAGSSSEQGSDSPFETPESAPSKQKKSGKKGKKRKVKGWAGAILPRKPKGQSKRPKASAVRPPTPPASTVPPDDDDEEAEKWEAQSPEVTTPTVTVTESVTPPREPDLSRRFKDDASPMIDLDAALGPFNTPLPHNPEWEAAQRAAGSVGKRRLHSAQVMKGFSGPGMHYHRRAESAPDLPPFDPGRSSLHRFGSSSTMADVFEEEEEEDEEDSDRSESADQKSLDGEDSDGETTPPAKKAPSLVESLDATPQIVRRKSSGLSDKDQAAVHSVRTERSRTSLQEDVIVEELPSVIFRTSNMYGERDSSERPASSPKKMPGAKEFFPVDVNTIHIPPSGAMPTSPYSTSASSYPSPRSPMSVDAQRISTAPSSITDENSFHSLLMGEPGPEVRISMDYDIPSLTSSTSTMTRESSFIPNPRLSQPTLRDQRPMSVSSAAFGRRRSSLVSLSRLISSSHGERSKLSMEVRLDEPESRRSRHSKTKRLGRMMQFWKPSKEDAST